jgi:DNA-binding winged helix-turn-helix (wHTH) protein
MSWGKFEGRKLEGPHDNDNSEVSWEGIVAVQEKDESSFLSSPLLSGPQVRFDVFELDAGKGHLLRSGLPVDLSPQLLTILGMLAGRPGQVVTRKEIKEALWPGQSFGDFDSRLNFAIKKLREALGDDAEHPRYVQTVRNAGYRFIAPVREPQALSSVVRDPDWSESKQIGVLPRSMQGALVSGKGLQVGMNGPFLALVTVVVIAIAVTTVLVLRHRGADQSVFSEVRRQPQSNDSENGQPRIDSVTPILPQPRQRIAIKGTSFGLHVPYTRTDSPYLAIRDKTSGWAAGRIIPRNYDDVMMDVENWTDTEIVVSGFSGDYGRKGWKLNPGDDLEIAVWNPQSGLGPALYHLKVNPNGP